MIFYSKSMILAEINYHIYNKKLLIIIRCFKHWQFELKCTELLIQIFIDHQALKIFMKNKQLSRRQVNYLNILSKFNFQIIFKSDKMNTKVNMLTQMSLANVFESAKWFEDCFQTILIFDRVDILSIDLKSSANLKSEVNLYQWVWLVNQMNEFCSKYKQAKNDNKLKLHIIALRWRTAKLLMTFYLEKIYCESLRTCIRNYYKKCMINLQSFISTINESLI